MQKQNHNSNTQPTHPQHMHHHTHQHEYHNQQEQQQQEYEGRESQVAHWKLKQQRKKYRKQIFGEHYNYNYRRPNQHKMYRIQENRNTEIERSNRILLEKIQSIFKRSMGRKKIKQINTQQTPSMSELTNKTSQMAVQSQPHSTSNITASHKRSIQQQLQLKMLSKPQRKSTNISNKIGQISKNIALAKNQLNHAHTHDISNSKSPQLNKNHIKLEQLQAQAISRRKRIQTQISRPVQKNKGEKQLHNQVDTQHNQLYGQSDEYYKPNININSNKKTSRKTITSNSQNSPNSKHKDIEHQNNKETNRPSSSKIILHKSTITLNNQPYRIELYVEGSTYIISSRCIKNGRQFHELITMPYKHYQQLYKLKLNQCHENIYQYLFVEPVKGLLQVSGFESKFMDIFEYGEIQLNDISPKSKEKQKEIQKESRASQEISNIIVHFNSNNMNVDDTFDRITYVNSQFKNEKAREVNSTPGPLTDHHENQNKKPENIHKQTQQATSNKKEAIVMTDPILPELKTFTPQLQESKIQPITSSQVQSRLIRKEQKFSSNLISLQIGPAQPAEEVKQDDMKSKQDKQELGNNIQMGENQNDISIDIEPTPQKKTGEGKKTTKVYQPYQQEQYENIEIIQDNP